MACTFGLKATNAFNAGAAGVVIYNNAPGALNGTLGNAFDLPVPVVGIEQALGQELAATAGLVLHLATQTLITTTTTSNVIAELPGKNTGNVVMAGAHLDSVAAGPGINDNGSGSAALVEVAENLAKVRPQNTVRFAWWGAEEANLVGSTYYVTTLPEAEVDRIAFYLNFDMIGSPNYVFFIYDGDDSDVTGAGPGPDGSARSRRRSRRSSPRVACRSRAPTSPDAPTTARSSRRGSRPAGSSPERRASRPRRRRRSGAARRARRTTRATTRRATRTRTTTTRRSRENSDAIAYAALSYAMSTSLINGTKSKGNFRPPAAPAQ